MRPYALKNAVGKGKGITVGEEEQKRVEEAFLVERQFQCPEIVVEDDRSLEAELKEIKEFDLGTTKFNWNETGILTLRQKSIEEESEDNSNVVMVNEETKKRRNFALKSLESATKGNSVTTVHGKNANEKINKTGAKKL